MGVNVFRLSDRERELLVRYCDFYVALANGMRKPTTEAQAASLPCATVNCQQSRSISGHF